MKRFSAKIKEERPARALPVAVSMPKSDPF